MRIKGLTITVIAALTISGCAHQTESTPDMYQNVDVVLAAPGMVAVGEEPLQVGSIKSKGILLYSSVYARDKGDMIEIVKIYERSDMDNLPVAYSRYLYKFNGAFLELDSHSAEQTGLIGSWPIPRLDKSDVERLVTIGSSKGFSLYNNNVADIKDSDDHVTLKPSLRSKDVIINLTTQRKCDDVGYKALGGYNTTFILNDDNTQFIGHGECDSYTNTVSYQFPQSFNALLRDWDKQGRAYGGVTIHGVTYSIPALGFTYAEHTVRKN
ncbi:hypothetical protein AB6E95_22280 [Vibrio splendidus]